MKYLKLAVLGLIGLTLSFSNAFANVEQLKTYRKVYPDFKPKCNYCHIDEKPKKEDGGHELNAYGLKLKELMVDDKLTEEMIQSIGNHEDFQKQESGGTEFNNAISVNKDTEVTDK